MNPDSVPSTIEAAVTEITDPSDHIDVGLSIRNNWSLWDNDTPLKREAVKRFGIAHADDISDLIRSWAAAIQAGEDFDPVEHCKQYHEHWKRMGTDALTAGDWSG